LKIKQIFLDLFDLGKSNTVWMVLVGASLTIANLSHGFIGSFSRYIADDFCTAGKLRSLGFWEAQTFWYENWSGRYSFTFFVSLFESFWDRIAIILPTLLIVLLYASVFLFLRTILMKLEIKKRNIFAFFLSSVFVFMVFFTIPDVEQDLYWMTGATTYLLPNIFFFFMLAYLVNISSRQSYSKLVFFIEIMLAFVFSFILAGFSEVMSVLQIIIYVGIYLFIVLAKKKFFIDYFLIAFILGAVFGLVIMILAPGNEVRLSGQLRFV
jgi:hypothetical protein